MKRNRLSSVCLNVILLIFSIATILPFLWMFASSFKSNSEISALGMSREDFYISFLKRPPWSTIRTQLRK